MKDKQSQTDFSSVLPPEIQAKPVETVELLAEAARRDPEHAAALLEWVGQDLSADDLTGLLINAAGWVGGYLGQTDDAKRLGWCDRLIQRGADPFACKAEEGGRRYEDSLAERLARAGYWEYLSALADRQGEQSMSRAKEALARMEARPYSAGDLRRKALEGGPRGVAFLTRAGFDPNALVEGEPWVFKCQDGATLEALAAAGADLSVKGKNGLSLEERVSQRPPGRARQGMLEALRGRLGSQPLDPKQALKAMASLAVDGAHKEISKLAAGAGLDLATASDASGQSMLGIALLNANWPLAADLMTLSKADPARLCPVDGIPTGALALWARDPSLKKPSKAKMKRQQECLKLALSEAVVAWSSPQGESLLEACSKRVPERRKGYERVGSWNEEAAKAAIEATPIDQADPLWARLSDWGRGIELIAFAAARRDEPWLIKGKGLMATGLTAHSTSWLRGSTALAELESAVSSSRSRSRSVASLFSLPQWALAFEAFWGIAAKERDSEGGIQQWGATRRAASEIERCLRSCARWSKSGAMPQLDFGAVSDLIQEGFNPARGLVSSAGGWARDFADALRIDAPEQFATLTLDLLARDEPEAVGAADALWERVSERGAALVWPKDHPVFEVAVSEARAKSPLWAALLEMRSELAESPPPARAARRL